jgi:integrase
MSRVLVADTVRTQKMPELLTDRVVKGLPPASRANQITYDTDIKGFGVRVTAAGAKAFIVNYRVDSRERRITIGSYPDWSAAAARKEAIVIKRCVDRGEDPMADRHDDRATPKVAFLAQRYLSEHASRKALRAQADDKSMIEKLVLPALGQTKVDAVSHDDIDQLHRSVSTTRPIRANRMVQMLSKMFNLAIRWGYRPDNPVKGVRKNPEDKRTRYLTNAEVQRLNQALGAHSNRQSANIIRVLLLTGSRRGEVMNAEWDHFDLDAGIWVKPSAHTKQKREHRVPLSKPTIELLNLIRDEAPSPPSRYVFPSASRDQPQNDIKKFWAGICKLAGLRDLRIHDLRHTYASILASSGLSLPVIGALLGHTQPNTTARYSHLFDDPLREATERVGAVIANSGR